MLIVEKEEEDTDKDVKDNDGSDSIEADVSDDN